MCLPRRRQRELASVLQPPAQHPQPQQAALQQQPAQPAQETQEGSGSHSPAMGFEAQQLQTLWYQIVAFRRLKIGDIVHPDLLAAVNPLPLVPGLQQAALHTHAQRHAAPSQAPLSAQLPAPQQPVQPQEPQQTGGGRGSVMGFAPQQLRTLRSQILAFRRLKIGETVPPDLLAAVEPLPLVPGLHQAAPRTQAQQHAAPAPLHAQPPAPQQAGGSRGSAMGFAPQQLGVLRSQIQAFRHLKRGRQLPEQVMAGVRRPPLAQQAPEQATASPEEEEEDEGEELEEEGFMTLFKAGLDPEEVAMARRRLQF